MGGACPSGPTSHSAVEVDEETDMMKSRNTPGTLRMTVHSKQVFGTMVIVAVPVASALRAAEYGSFRHHLDLFGSAMNSPLLLLLPLALTVLTCRQFGSEVRHRFTSAQGMRTDIGWHVARRFAAAMTIAFTIAFLCSAVPYILAFHLWPLLGDPRIDPAGYLLSPSQAAEDSYGSASYTHLLRSGDIVFGVAYSAWLGFCGAVYAATGMTALLLVRSGLLALAAPLITVIGETLAAALPGHPHLGLFYSAFPFSLTRAPDAVAMLPHLVLAAVVAVVAAITVHRMPLSGRLS